MKELRRQIKAAKTLAKAFLIQGNIKAHLAQLDVVNKLQFQMMRIKS